MVPPNSFSFDDETATSNSFQTKSTTTGKSTTKSAMEEFYSFTLKLQNNGLDVIYLQHPSKKILPNAVFPNNWFATYGSGDIVIFPLRNESRKKEKSIDHLVTELKQKNFLVRKTIDLSYLEESGLALEGTGSLVLDREKNIAFAVRSERTSQSAFNTYCDLMGIQSSNRIIFRAIDRNENPIYHTNVMMSIGNEFVIICKESIDIADRDSVLCKLEDSKKELIYINYDQLENFCGNCLNVATNKGNSSIVMSTRAYNSFTSAQKRKLEKYGTLIHSEINCIENVGGGSARCMIAEIFLPKSN